jgi:hypothetical protein
MTPELALLQAYNQRFIDAGYTTKFGLVLDPDRIADEQLPVLTIRMGGEGIAPSTNRPRKWSEANFVLEYWVRLADQDQPMFECMEHLGLLKNIAYKPNDGIHDTLLQGVEVRYLGSNIDMSFNFSGVALISVAVAIDYMG